MTLEVDYMLDLSHVRRVTTVVLEINQCLIDLEYLLLKLTDLFPLQLTLFEERILSHLDNHGLVRVPHVLIKQHLMYLSLLMSCDSFVAF